MSNIDNVTPKEKWKFDKDVADCFENMLERSIPNYRVMRNLITQTVVNSISINPNKKSINILDLGCSDGLMIESMKDRLDSFNNDFFITGCDCSQPMIDKALNRFKSDSNINIINCDLRDYVPKNKSGWDVVTSCLTIQFTPIEYRQRILHNIYMSLNNHSVFIMVEKVLGNTNEINDLMVNTYYDMKRDNGYSNEQIENKRKSLEGVLVPVTNDMNIQFLKSAGFSQVDVFWRWMNFVGYIAIK